MPDGKKAAFPWGMKREQIDRAIVALRNLRQKYPEYEDLTDQDLARRIIARYPMYGDVLGPVSESPTGLAALNAELGLTCPGRDEISSATLKILGLGPSWFTRLGAGTQATQIAALLVVLLWAAFYVLRWIVHGFAER